MKKFYVEDMEKGKKIEWIFPIVIFVVFMIIVIKGLFYLDYMSDMQNVDLVRQSVKRAAVQCYAIEGAYPTDIEYLEEQYGVTIDHDKYYIEMEGFASNIMPNIEVYERY